MASDVNVTKQNGSDSITTIAMAVAAAATGLAQAQAVAAAGNLNLNGALIAAAAYTSTGARRMVCVSTDAADTTQTVTFYGTNRDGIAQTEAVTLNGVTIVTTQLDFLTVTRVAVSAATAGNMTAGTSAKASGAWVPIDRAANNPINIQLRGRLVTGAGTFSVEETMYDPNGNQDGTLFPAALGADGTTQVGTLYPPEAFDDATITAKAATTNGTIAAPFWAYRLTVTAGTGTIQLIGLASLKPWHA